MQEMCHCCSMCVKHQTGRGTQKHRQLMRQSKCMISGYQSLIRITLGWHTAARTEHCNKKRYKRLDKAWCSLCGPRPLRGPSLLVLDSLFAGRPRWLATLYIVLNDKGNCPAIRPFVLKKRTLLRPACVKLRPDHSCASVNVDVFTNPIQSSAISWSRALQGFATVSVW
jgi:hypothetical protein